MYRVSLEIFIMCQPEMNSNVKKKSMKNKKMSQFNKENLQTLMVMPTMKGSHISDLIWERNDLQASTIDMSRL